MAGQNPKMMMVLENTLMAEALSVLARGGIIVTPTDTVCGLMADFECRPALERIYRLKRTDLRQTALLCSDVDSFSILEVEFTPVAQVLARYFWPGALTLVVRSASDRIQHVAGPNNTIGIRIPDCQPLRTLLAQYGRPLAATSANFSGTRAPAFISEVAPEILSGVDMVLELQVTPSGLASSVVDCTQQFPKILREGAIKTADIMERLKTNE